LTPELVDTAQKLGYHTVLGSVWPWDVYSKSPLLNALYISAKVYPGAVIVLHDRWARQQQARWHGRVAMHLCWWQVQQCRLLFKHLCHRRVSIKSSLLFCEALKIRSGAVSQDCCCCCCCHSIQAPPPAANPAVCPTLVEPPGLCCRHTVRGCLQVGGGSADLPLCLYLPCSCCDLPCEVVSSTCAAQHPLDRTCLHSTVPSATTHELLPLPVARSPCCPPALLAPAGPMVVALS
jgi:hypothetical protein